MPRRARARMGPGTYVVLRSIMIFDALLLIAVAAILAAFMARPAGLIGAGLCLLGAGMCLGGARWADRLYDRSA